MMVHVDEEAGGNWTIGRSKPILINADWSTRSSASPSTSIIKPYQ